jgi:hypothetical protein
MSCVVPWTLAWSALSIQADVLRVVAGEVLPIFVKDVRWTLMQVAMICCSATSRLATFVPANHIKQVRVVSNIHTGDALIAVVPVPAGESQRKNSSMNHAEEVRFEVRGSRGVGRGIRDQGAAR